jgi:hypothetical protein
MPAEVLDQPEPRSVASPRDESRHWRAGLLLAVLLGVTFRVTQYLWRHSIWHDEASLLLNIARKSARELLGPLQYHQAAPPLFLLSLKGLYTTLGGSEYVVRSVSLLSGVIALALFAFLSWRLLPKPQAVIATTFFALSEKLIWHSVEVKQYSGDVLVAVALLCAALINRDYDPPTRRFVRVGAIAAVGVWFSHPTIFTYAAISLAFLPELPRRRSSILLWTVINIVVALSLAIVYVACLRFQQEQGLVNSWRELFVPWSKPLSIPWWLVRAVVGLCDYPIQGMGGGLILLLSIFGIHRLWMAGRRFELAVLAVPFVFLLMASAVAQFPFGGSRATVFTAPMLLLLSGHGCVFLQSSNWKPFRLLALGSAAALIVWSLIPDLYHLAVPRTKEIIRPVAEYVMQSPQPSDGIYVVGKDTQHEFMWYWRNQSKPALYREDSPDLTPWSRFWVVGGYMPQPGFSSIAKDLAKATEGCKELERFQGEGGAAILFTRDLTAQK